MDGLVGGFVVPDRGGEGEKPLEHAGHDASRAPCAVALQVELRLEGLVDGFDDLTERFEEPLSGSRRFGPRRRPDELDAEVGHDGVELLGPVALVRHQGLAGVRSEETGFDVEQVAGDLALVDLRVREGEGDGKPRRRGDEMQPQAPEEPGMRRAVPVAGPPGQVRALRRLTGAPALDGRGVDPPQVVLSDLGRASRRPAGKRHRSRQR